MTDMRDYSQETLLKNSLARVAEMQGTTPQAKAERIETINAEMRKRGM